MGTQQQTTTKNSYAPGALNQYQSFMKTYSPLLQQFATNPFNNPQFSLNLNQNMQAANQTNMNAFQNAMSQFNMTGFGGAPSGARTQLTSQLGRYGSGVNANAFYSAANNAIGRQNSAINSMMAFNPLQTGGQQTQTTGGLGTWLPQVAGAAIGGLSSLATMGATGAAGGMGSFSSAFYPGAAGAQGAPSSTGGAMSAFFPGSASGPSPLVGGGAGLTSSPYGPAPSAYNFI